MVSSTLKFDEDWLLRKLARLQPASRVICALLAANRLFPSYVRFHELTGRGNAQELAAFASRLWQNLLAKKMARAELEAAIPKIHSLLPAEEESWDDEARAGAEDAASALLHAYRARLSCEEQEAAWALRCAYDAMNRRAQQTVTLVPSHPAYEMALLSHVEVQRELHQQRRDLTDVEDWEKSGCDRVELLRLEDSSKLPSEDLAGLIVDALVMGGLVKKEDYERAVSIATEEIEVRKAVGDY